MPNILLTGGAGFIGSHLSEKLLSFGYNLTVIDNFDDFYPEVVKRTNIAGLLENKSYRLIEADIRDKTVYTRLSTTKFDAIIHLAAKAGVRPSIQQPELYEDVNMNGTLNLLEFARKNSIKHFVFTSSSSVYGVNPNVPWKEDLNLYQVISPYAATKLSGEHIGHVYSHLYGIRFIALRLFTVFGPRQRPDLAIHKFAKQIVNDEEITLFGDGSTSRDYTFVADIVDGYTAALNYTQSNFEVFNLGNSNTVTLLEMVEGLEKVFGKTARKKFMEEQPGDVPRTFADISKASQLLSYNPKTNFLKGLEAFRDWYLKTH
ncbi:MAG: GDP-mannose 4,6-dehydratase [Chitinophagales bacterium]|nr:GDP-mannose 4,6-dehydratase [Chitinophagales bacterium]